MTWLAYIAAALIVGAVVAGVWPFARKTNKAQTIGHFAIKALRIAGPLTLGSFQKYPV